MYKKIEFDWYIDEYLSYKVITHNGNNACWSEWKCEVWALDKNSKIVKSESISTCFRSDKDLSVGDIKNIITGIFFRNYIKYERERRALDIAKKLNINMGGKKI